MMDKKTLLPLAGIRVLDFSGLLPGPYASRLLADMGAEIIRVEAPDRLDLVRVMPPIKNNQSAVDGFLNSGKSSVALNLKDPEVIALLKKSVCDFDVVIEQFRPGVMPKLGLGYDDLKSENASLIYCSITGYGQTGPLSHKAGHDINYLALAGCVDYSRRKGQRPTPYSIQVADIAGGSHHAVMSILAALYQRQSNAVAPNKGEGQYLDISMSDAALSLNVMSSAASLNGEEISPQSQILQGKSYYDFYETKDGRYFSVGSLEPKFITGLCIVIKQPQLVSVAVSQRQEDIDTFKRLLEIFFIERTFSELVSLFSSTDLCVEPVLTLKEALEHPHFKERNMVLTGSSRSDVKSAFGFTSGRAFYSNNCRTNTLSSEACGESTEVFLDQLGVEDSTIKTMRSRRAIK